MAIVLEGTDYAGKSTLAVGLRELGLDVHDRSPLISGHMQLASDEGAVSQAVAQAISSVHADDVVVFLLVADDDLLIKRREEVGVRDAYDAQAEAYGRLYWQVAHSAALAPLPNVLRLVVDPLSLAEQLGEVMRFVVEGGWIGFDLQAPTIEGHSKRIYASGGLALVELKPSLFSITHNRYETDVSGTDELRLGFWELLGGRLNARRSREQLHREYLPLACNFLSRVSLGGRDYALTRFAERISPLEIIYKRYLVGTMKHRLLGIDQQPTRFGPPLAYESELPREVIRFDWRNPVPDEQIAGQRARPVEDEPIPEDFAEFYIDIAAARERALWTAHATNDILEQAHYRLVDTCYFMDERARMVYSEITPDGMRVKAADGSGAFDKDLWRQGKDAETLCRVWGQLLADLQTTAGTP